jgi:hypothetical protein
MELVNPEIEETWRELPGENETLKGGCCNSQNRKRLIS